MCSHYVVEPVACIAACGWERGRVKNQVGPLLQTAAAFNNYDELNALRLRQDTSPPRVDELGRVRGRADPPRSLCRPVQRFPHRSGLRLKHLSNRLRQQEVLGGGERCRAKPPKVEFPSWIFSDLPSAKIVFPLVPLQLLPLPRPGGSPAHLVPQVSRVRVAPLLKKPVLSRSSGFSWLASS
jgi:hypothetical protein